MQNRFLCFLLPGIFAFLPAPSGIAPSALPHPEFVLSHNQFAFRLLHVVLDEDSSQCNKLVSPLSLYLSLGMLCNGAAHETRDSITEALQAADLELSNLNGLCKQTLQELPLEDDHVQFTLANAIWYNRKKYSVLPEYEQLMENFYYAPLQPLDFSSRAAAARINDWIATSTDKQITNAIEQTHSTDAMIMVNALYFKSAWLHPFALSDTYKEKFYTQDGNIRPAHYMRKTQIMNTFSDTSFTMVELPCGEGKDFALYILQPQDQGLKMSQWIAVLDASRMSEAFDKMTPQYLDLSLPRWECTYAINDGQAVLDRMGMGTTFATPGLADFSNMYTGGARKAALTRLIHDTHIKVDEEGLVASGTSGAETNTGAEKSKANGRVIRFDHPFVYFLMEKEHNLILMAGVVSDPVKKPLPPPPASVPARHRLSAILHRGS